MPEIVKISELSAAVALDGTELVPITQDAVTVRTTTGDIADLAADTDAVAFPYFPIHFAVSPGSTTVQPSISGLTSPTNAGTAANATPDAPPTSLLTALNRNTYTGTAATNSSAGAYLVGTLSGVFRALSAVASGAGFRLDLLFAWNTVAAAQRAWAGLFGSVTPFSASSDPSAAVNSLFFAKDAADTNLQVMHNDGSGTATKVDTGVAFSTLTGKLLRMRITVTPGSANPLLELDDLSTGVAVSVYSYTPTTDLPAADQRLWWQAMANSAAVATSVVTTFVRASFYTRFGSFGA